MDVSPEHLDDPESPDAEPALDVTPATGRHAVERAGGGRKKVWVGVLGLGLIVVALAAVLFNGLSDASTFFYNVDEAVAKKPELQGDRFRMQGNVLPGSVTRTAEGVDFTISYKGVKVPVRHTGDPPELFGPEIPVVLEGTFEGDTFRSDQILIRHDNTYDEQNPDRIKDAEKDAQQAGAAG
ncbi:MAG: cytochrome c maturation protein CcmE [Microthrixaceae bacterium]